MLSYTRSIPWNTSQTIRLLTLNRLCSFMTAVQLFPSLPVRRIPVPRLIKGGCSDPSLTALQKLCIRFYLEQTQEDATNLPINPNKFSVSFTYLDEENDSIVFSTDVEFLEALRFSPMIASDVSSLTSSSGHEIRFLRVSAVVEPRAGVTKEFLRRGDDTFTAANEGKKAHEVSFCSSEHVIKEEKKELLKKEDECEAEKHFSQENNSLTTPSDNTENEGRRSTQVPEVIPTPVSGASSDSNEIIIQKEEYEAKKPCSQRYFSLTTRSENTENSGSRNMQVSTPVITSSSNSSPTTGNIQQETNPPRACSNDTTPNVHPIDVVSSFFHKAGQLVHNIQFPTPPKSNHACPLERLRHHISKLNEDQNNSKNKKTSTDIIISQFNFRDGGCFLDFDPKFVHARHQCDLCRCLPIVGFRWHAFFPPLTPSISASASKRFANFDLCHSCYIRWREDIDENMMASEIPREIRFRPVQYGELY